MAKKRTTIHGVPCDWGASKRGASAGPAAVRRANIVADLRALGLSVDDAGDVPVAKTENEGKSMAGMFRLAKGLEKRVFETVRDGSTPIILGGDHSLAIGSVSGISRACRAGNSKLGLIWVDAHADINTPQSSPTGNFHGMPLAHLVGLGDRRFTHLGGFCPKVDPRNVCLIGVRDVDSGEAANIRKSGIRVFSMKEIDRFGLGLCVEQAIDIASDDTAGFHVSFDIDVVDPGSAPGTGTLKRGGISYREAHLLMELASDSERLRGLDLVEVNPLEDTHNATAELAVELISSAMGKSIY